MHIGNTAFNKLPGDEGLLALPLRVVPLLVVVVVRPAPLLRPLAVPLPGPGAAPAGAPHADPLDVPGLMEPVLVFFSFPFPVSGLRKFWTEVVRRQISASMASTAGPRPAQEEESRGGGKGD